MKIVMNNKINEIIKEATITRLSFFDGKNNIVETDFSKEHFAKLILEEVEKIIDKLYHESALEQAAILLTLDENIKIHFYGKD